MSASTASSFWVGSVGPPPESVLLGTATGSPLLADRVQSLQTMRETVRESRPAVLILECLAGDKEVPYSLRAAAIETIPIVGPRDAAANVLFRLFSAILSIPRMRLHCREAGNSRRAQRLRRQFNRERRAARAALHSKPVFELAEAIIAGLEKLGHAEALERILAASVDRPYGVSAAKSLMRLSREFALPAIATALVGSRTASFSHSLRALLGEFGENANQAVLEAIRVREMPRQGGQKAVLFLGENGCVEAEEDLLTLARSARALSVRCSAILALGKLKTGRGLDALILMAKTERNTKVQRAVRQALTAAGVAAIPKLVLGMKNVHGKAAQSLVSPMARIGARALDAMREGASAVPVPHVVLDAALSRCPDADPILREVFTAHAAPEPWRVQNLIRSTVAFALSEFRNLVEAFRPSAMRDLGADIHAAIGSLSAVHSVQACLGLLLGGVRVACAGNGARYPLRL